MRSKKVTFKNDLKQDLDGRIDLPLDLAPKGYVLFAHCFTCSKDLFAVENISNALTGEGFAVLRFDFTGLGASEGQFESTNFSSNLEDLNSAYRFLEREYEAPQLMMGHSLGGTAVLHVAGSLPGVKAVITIGSPCDPRHVRNLITNKAQILESGEEEVSIGGRPFRIQRQFLEDLDKIEAVKVIRNLDRPLLIMHSPDDNIVGIENASDIYMAARHPKSFIALDGANHLLTRSVDSRFVGLMAASWASRYLEVQDTISTDDEGEVHVRTGPSGYRTEVFTGHHHMIADEPLSVGGTNEGPSPYNYLLAALGSCTSMTLRMYADHKKIKLDEVEVTLTHAKVHRDDCEDCEGSTGRIDEIKRKITLTGDLTTEQRSRLMEIADRCPVHKTLSAKPVIDTFEKID